SQAEREARSAQRGAAERSQSGGRPSRRPLTSRTSVAIGAPTLELERNILVVGRGARGAGLAHRVRAAGACGAGIVAFAAAEELDCLCDDLCRLPLLALLVLPLAGLEPALDVDAASLREIVRAVLCLLAPDDDAMPLRPLLRLAVAVGPAVVG